MRKYIHYLLSLCVCVNVLISSGSLAAQPQTKEAAKANTDALTSQSSNPYCGLYCLYLTMKLADKEVDFKDLIKPEYLGSRKGSSLAELKKSRKR